METAAFESVVREAIDALPPHLREQIKDVVIVIEDRPGPRLYENGTVRPGTLLLGLYEGIPLSAWGRDFNGKVPDRISIFREPIELIAGTPERISAVIRETVWHEIGHYFGLDHAQIGKMEQRWRRKRREPPLPPTTRPPLGDQVAEERKRRQ
jgi:predicted Zn-dependent protease with MMP-like domain